MPRPPKYATEEERQAARRASRAAYEQKHQRTTYAYRNREARPTAAPKPATPPPSRPFVAIDGEGYDTRAGKHVYYLLGASDGTSIEAKRGGLKTRDVFTYLLDLQERHPRGILVAFSINYDMNMWLGDVPLSTLDGLRKHGAHLFFDRARPGWGWRVEWMPGKWVAIAHGETERTKTGALKLKAGARSVRIYDVFGFFQQSFVGALREWNVGSADEHARLLAMKTQRADFARVARVAVADYNALECRLLVALMERVRDALEQVGVRLTRWHGAGAIGSELLKQHNVKQHNAPPDDLEGLGDAIKGAYFGGRVQMLRPGIHARAWSHDLNSAYPWAMTQLPSLKGTWRRRRGWPVQPQTAGLWLVEWDLTHDTAVCPFPWRADDGIILYPYRGRGWYWTPEVAAALKAYPGHIKVEWGYELHPDDADARPFAWISDLYARRLDYRARGEYGAQLVIKLGLNSISGKLAQRPGYHGAGPCQSLVWAGLLTALVRARLLTLASVAPAGVIAFATDGVFATVPLHDDELGKPLGGWELGEGDDLIIVQSGIYEARQPHSGLYYSRARGFAAGELDFARMREEWGRRGIYGSVDVQVRRFVGVRGAVARAQPDLWRRWVCERRHLSFYPQRGFGGVVGEDDGYVVYGPDCGGVMSHPYGGGAGADWAADKWAAELDEQPGV